MTRFDFLRDPLPEFVDWFMAARLPRRLYIAVVVFATVSCAIVAAGAIESFRVRSASVLEQRAERRFEMSRVALSAARLEWEQLDALVSRDRRLRGIRLSGIAAASRIAHVGNAFPERAWVTSMTAVSGNYAFKGRAVDLPVVEQILTNLLNDRSIERPQGPFRVTREDAGRDALAFEIQSGSGP